MSDQISKSYQPNYAFQRIVNGLHLIESVHTNDRVLVRTTHWGHFDDLGAVRQFVKAGLMGDCVLQTPPDFWHEQTATGIAGYSVLWQTAFKWRDKSLPPRVDNWTFSVFRICQDFVWKRKSEIRDSDLVYPHLDGISLNERMKW